MGEGSYCCPTINFFPICSSDGFWYWFKVHFVSGYLKCGEEKPLESRKWWYMLLLLELWVYASTLQHPWQLPVATWEAYYLVSHPAVPSLHPSPCHLRWPVPLPRMPGLPQFQATFTSADLKIARGICSWLFFLPHANATDIHLKTSFPGLNFVLCLFEWFAVVLVSFLWP